MQEMDRRVALLRLLLADITNREDQANDTRSQLRTQLKRIVDFTIQYNGGVANALAAMAEVEERLSQQETLLRHLALLRKRARTEMEALLVTRGVADARTRLAELQQLRAALLQPIASDQPPEHQPAPDTPTAGDAASGPRGDDVTSTANSDELAHIDAEIAALHAQIEAASDAAARSLARGGDEQDSGRSSSSSPR
jgi:hypothetical protein